MKKTYFILIFLLSITLSFGQDSSVEATGTGVTRTDAIQDALRNAVGQAAGVALSSNTTVENFMVISDAIASNTKGYIKSYAILNEKNDISGFEIKVKAVVTTLSMKADFSLLAKGIGGVRFMAIYDPRSIPADQEQLFNHAIDQMNSYFASKRYRYIERTRFLELQKEAMLMMEDRDTSGVSYAQQLAMLADAQFIILVKNISKETTTEQFDTKKNDQITIQTVMYDNCTAEGLGTESLKSSFIDAINDPNSMRSGISSAVKKDMDNVLETFSDYIGGWINNGIPYELRFYSTGGFRDLRDLRTKLKTDVLFGGEMEIISAQDFTKINCTFKKKPDELADKVLDFSDLIPVLAAKKIDVKLIYGRQISFAPLGFDIKKKKIATLLPKQNPTKTQPKQSIEQTQVSTTSSSEVNEKIPGFSIFTEGGEKFWLVINGQKVNEKPTTNVGKSGLADEIVKIRILFLDSKIPPIDDKIMLANSMSGEKYFSKYTIRKNNKGRLIVRLVSANQVYAGKNETQITELKNNDAIIQTPQKDSREESKINNCKTAINSEDFQMISMQISAEPFSETKKMICQQITTIECFNVTQIKSICNLFSFEEDKLAWLKMAYNSCTEQNKYYLLNSVFTFSSSKEAFNKFLLGNK